MCGLIYQRGGKVSEGILHQYKRQRNRGSDGFGFVVVNGTAKRHRYTTEAETFYKLGQLAENEIIFHHRFPTSTGNTAKQNHPIFTDQYALNYYLIHNGVINNSLALKDAHAAAGYKYETEAKTTTHTSGFTASITEFNDSEALLHELAQFIEGKKQTIDAQGSIAFLLLQTDKEGVPLRLYYGRNSSNPLKIHEDGDVVRIASELKDGKNVPANELFFYDYRTGKTSSIKADIGTEAVKGYDWDDYPQAKYEERTYDNEYDTPFYNEANYLYERAYDLYESGDSHGLAEIIKDAKRIAKKFKPLDADQRDMVQQLITDCEYYQDEIDKVIYS